MHVGMFLDWYPEPGGLTSAVDGLARALAQLGGKVTIFAHGKRAEWTDAADVTIRTFKRPALGRYGRASPDLRSALRGNFYRLDLLVLAPVFSTCLPELAGAAREGDIPVIFAPHDPYHDALFQHKRVKKQIYFRLREQALLNSADAVQVLAPSHESWLRKRGIRTRVIVVPNGLDVAGDHTEQSTPAEPGRRASNGVTIGFLGRLAWWHKGLDILLQGFAAVRNDLPDLHLVLAGSPPSQRDAEQISDLIEQLRLRDAVEVVGYVDREPADVIAEWDILACPSRFDGFPLTVLEAMAARRPILCSVEAGVWEYIQGAGCAVGVRPTAEGVARGMHTIMERRSEWHHMGELGRAHLEAHLTWNNAAAIALPLYQTMST